MYSKIGMAANDKTTNNLAFVTLTFAQIFHVFNMSSGKSKLLVNEITKNKYIWLAILLCTFLTVLVFTFSKLRLVLGLELMPTRFWLVAIAASVLPLLSVQGYKVITAKSM